MNINRTPSHKAPGHFVDVNLIPVGRQLQSERHGVTRSFLRALLKDFVDGGREHMVEDEKIKSRLRAMAEEHGVRDVEQVVNLAFSEDP